nr:translocase of chloroplast 159, chloroplastic [Tanacetum cinerariifolium]
TFPRRLVVGEAYPQRHVAGETPIMSLGKDVNVVVPFLHADGFLPSSSGRNKRDRDRRHSKQRKEVKQMKEMKKQGNSNVTEQAYQEEDGEGDAPAPVAVLLPDIALPPSFDSDNHAYRFRFLEPSL